jgi:hypothetical protein
MAKVCTICYWPEDIRRVVRKVEILLVIEKIYCMCIRVDISEICEVCVKGRGYF